MSIAAGLSLGESFAEFTATSPGAAPTRARWQFARKRLAEGLKEALLAAVQAEESALAKSPKANPQASPRALTISSWSSESVIARRLGAQVAFLATDGFERWPKMALERADLRARRGERGAGSDGRSDSWSPISEHLQFGSSERMRADGSIRSPLDEAEIARIAAKLKLGKAPVAIAFLHARRNPAHEAKAAEILRGEGLHVVASHEVARGGANKSELEEPEAELWWRTALAAYAGSALAEEEREIRAAIEAAGGGWSARWANDGEALSEAPRLESAFGLETALARDAGDAETTLHFGLERFLAAGERPIRSGFPWFRAMRAEPASSRALSLQPLSRLSSDGRLAPRFLFEARGYEPGPMVFGKSLQPTALDVLSWRGRAAEVAGAPAFSSERATPRIAEALLTLGKAAAPNVRRPDPQAIAEDLEGLLLEGLIADLAAAGRRGPFRATGPLAAAVAPLLESRRPDWRIVTDPERGEWAASEALAKWSSERVRSGGTTA